MKNLFRRISFLVFALILVLNTVGASAAANQSPAGGFDGDYLKSMSEMIKEKYRGEVTDKQLMEGALKGMFGSMDPYTAYMNNEEYGKFMDSLNGSYVGIGIEVALDSGFAAVQKVFSGSPAEKAGFQTGDLIASVDGKDVEGKSLDEIVSLIRGTEGTKVVIEVLRSGKTGLLKLEAIRGSIEINPVTYRIKDGIGYIKLDIFSMNSAKEIQEALKAMDQNKITRIILDLRGNPGGEVNQAVSIARNFIPKGLITKLDFKSEAYKDQEYYSDLAKSPYKLALLVNGNSASASEILTGAVQDTKAGTVIGTKTFGKAKVQSMVPVLTPEAYEKYKKQLGKEVTDVQELMTKYGIEVKDDEIGGFTKITTGYYYTPAGRMIDLKGMMPDIQVNDPQKISDIDVTGINILEKKNKPRLNATGSDVLNAEKILKLSGYQVGAPDFKLDSKTFDAIKKFQKDCGLYPYGVLDFTTQQKLNEKLDGLLIKYDGQYAKAMEILKK